MVARKGLLRAERLAEMAAMSVDKRADYLAVLKDVQSVVLKVALRAEMMAER
jgi:hypothetical protein